MLNDLDTTPNWLGTPVAAPRSDHYVEVDIGSLSSSAVVNKL